MKQAMSLGNNWFGGEQGGDFICKTMVLMATGVLLLTGGAFAVEGGGKDSPGAAAVNLRVFNVLEYGAIGDDKTDNTEPAASRPKR